MSNLEKYRDLPLQIENLIDKTNVFNQISTRAADPNNSTLIEFKTFNDVTLKRIAEKMPEINRAISSFGRKNSQTTNKLMTLTMLNDTSPYRILRQCLAQIENRREAIKENVYKLKKSKIELEYLLEKLPILQREYSIETDDLKKIEKKKELQNAELEIEKLSYHLADSTLYIEGALKDIASFQEAYEEVRKNNNISENWDEKDFEEAEIKHHLRNAFLLAFRDCVSTGKINMGTLEYLQQFGIHPQIAEYHILQYIVDNRKKIQNDKISPTYTSLENFLDSLVEIFKDEYKVVLKRIGINNLIGDWYLYKEEK